VRTHHRFDRIGDNFAGSEGIFHSGVPHSNAVADGYSIKFERYATRIADGLLDHPGNFIEVNMTRHNLTEAVGNAYKRLLHIGITQAARTHQAPVRGTLKTLFHHITIHFQVSPKIIVIKLKAAL
jgi:hypothetical protein